MDRLLVTCDRPFIGKSTVANYETTLNLAYGGRSGVEWRGRAELKLWGLGSTLTGICRGYICIYIYIHGTFHSKQPPSPPVNTPPYVTTRKKITDMCKKSNNALNNALNTPTPLISDSQIFQGACLTWNTRYKIYSISSLKFMKLKNKSN